MQAEEVAAALLPYMVTNDVASHRTRLVVWSAGLAKILARYNGVVVKKYRAGKYSYSRTVAVIEYKLYQHVRRIVTSQRRLRRAVRKHRDIVVEAFKAYSPRGVGPETIKRRLQEILGPRAGASVFNMLLRRLRRTKTWIRMATHPRAYGFKVRLMACVARNREYYDAPDYIIEDACARHLRGDPFAFIDIMHYRV